MPLASGMIAMIHSKQPQEVIGFCIIVYRLRVSTAPPEAFLRYSSVPEYLPYFSSRTSPFRIGWFPPVGSISKAALQSSQLKEPQSPSLSGLITHTWVGAKD